LKNSKNNERPSIKYFELELFNSIKLGQIIIEPPFYKFPLNLNMNELIKKEFKLINKSDFLI
jgi:hypothetical protein